MRHQVDAGQVPLSHICATESYLTLQITNNAPPASPTGLIYKWTLEFPARKEYFGNYQKQRCSQVGTIFKSWKVWEEFEKRKSVLAV